VSVITDVNVYSIVAEIEMFDGAGQYHLAVEAVKKIRTRVISEYLPRRDSLWKICRLGRVACPRWSARLNIE
jgi:hypothetical protein